MELVGRQWEMAEADRFLDGVADGPPAALVLEGEPGIGKTTVWRAIVDSAQRRSYRILLCRSSESESALSFLGLGDLLESMSDAMFDALPEPQRQALQFALLRSSGKAFRIASPSRAARSRLSARRRPRHRRWSRSTTPSGSTRLRSTSSASSCTG